MQRASEKTRTIIWSWANFLLSLFLVLFFILFALSLVRGNDNLTPKGAKLELGHHMFFDNGMSLQGTMSCASCHIPDPKFGYSDGRKVAVGAMGQSGTGLGLMGFRRTKSLINSFAVEDQLSNWDGRAPGIYASCLQAVADRLVLGLPDLSVAINRMNSRPLYNQLSMKAFGSPLMTEANVRECFVVFLRTIRSTDTPADRLSMGMQVAVPAGVLRGWKVFEENCTACHDPDMNWRDWQFHNIGISMRSLSTVNPDNIDRGRFRITQNQKDMFAFGTPDLREVAKHPPYMHDGSLSSLKEVVNFFAHGGKYRLNGQILRDPNIDPLVAQISLDEKEQADLELFLTFGFQGSSYPFYENPHLRKKVAAK